MKRFLIGFACYAGLMSGAAQGVGLRNFREISAFYSVALQIPESSSNIQAVYGRIRSNLPPSSDVVHFSANSYLASSALGAVYCSEFVFKESRLQPSSRMIHQDVDFSLKPAQISPIVTAVVLESYAQRLWGRPMTDSEKATLAQFSQDLVPEIDEASLASFRYFRALCTVLAVSLDSLIVQD